MKQAKENKSEFTTKKGSQEDQDESNTTQETACLLEQQQEGEELLTIQVYWADLSSNMPDVKVRITRVHSRSGKLRHITLAS